MELWDVYDADRKKTGTLAKRGEPLGEGEHHITVHICIFSPDGKMLIQKRSKNKKGWADLWDITAAGSVIAGESSAEGAHRELIEEMGIDYDFTGVRPHFTMNFNHGFADWYLLDLDIPLSAVSFADGEVVDAKYVTREELSELLQADKVVPYFDSFLSSLFDIRQSKSVYGLHNINPNK